MPKGLEVESIQIGSIAEEMEIEPGDRILAIDNVEINDIIDFQYATAEESFRCLVEKKDGEIWELEIERFPGEVLGISFVNVDTSGLKMCRNNCVFCFVAQSPKNVRKTLNQKDDDYRLSLTQGSFITLSNLSEDEFERILRLHLSPLYISVHAWDRDVRVRLMRNKRAGDIQNQIERLVNADITMHVQIVLVPGYNDEEVLKETVEALAKYYPAIQSIGVVPVGLTKHRDNLIKLRPVTKAEAIKILEEGTTWQERYLNEHGLRLVYFSDEFYVLAGKEFPHYSCYDGFFQLENGIGMAAKFNREMKEAWSLLPTKIEPRNVHIITGTSASLYFDSWRRKLEQIEGLSIKLHIIKNRFFGETVTVAGLLTAQDIAEQVGSLNGEEFLIPEIMLKADEQIFLDDHSVNWLENKVNGKAIVVENNAFSFINGLLHQEVNPCG